MATFDPVVQNFLDLVQGFKPISGDVLGQEFTQSNDPFFNRLLTEAQEEATLRTGRLGEDVGTGVSRLQQQQGFLGEDVQRGLGRVGEQRGFFGEDIGRAREAQTLAFGQQQRGLNQQLGQQFSAIAGSGVEAQRRSELQQSQQLQAAGLASREQQGLLGFGQREGDLRRQQTRGDIGFGQQVSDLGLQKSRGVFDIEDFLGKRRRDIEQARVSEKGTFEANQRFRNFDF